jgi:ABC-type amino acid transport system permease subunit
MKLVGLMAVLYAFINEMALSLGITSTQIEYADGLTEMGDTNILEAIMNVFYWVVNNISSFMQLAFFTADIPDIFQALFFSPMLIMFLYLGLVTVRGGAS